MSPNGNFSPPAIDSLQILAGLIFVLGLIAMFAWSFRRFHSMGARNGAPVKIVTTLTLGTRERIAIIEVANQWLVIGITPGRMCTLAKLPRQELENPPQASAANDFSSVLSQIRGKSNAQ
jgi:flagellar protein FliO/FliZ